MRDNKSCLSIVFDDFLSETRNHYEKMLYLIMIAYFVSEEIEYAYDILDLYTEWKHILSEKYCYILGFLCSRILCALHQNDQDLSSFFDPEGWILCDYIGVYDFLEEIIELNDFSPIFKKLILIIPNTLHNSEKCSISVSILCLFSKGMSALWDYSACNIASLLINNQVSVLSTLKFVICVIRNNESNQDLSGIIVSFFDTFDKYQDGLSYQYFKLIKSIAKLDINSNEWIILRLFTVMVSFYLKSREGVFDIDSECLVYIDCFEVLYSIPNSRYHFISFINNNIDNDIEHDLTCFLLSIVIVDDPFQCYDSAYSLAYRGVNCENLLVQYSSLWLLHTLLAVNRRKKTTTYPEELILFLLSQLDCNSLIAVIVAKCINELIVSKEMILTEDFFCYLLQIYRNSEDISRHSVYCILSSTIDEMDIVTIQNCIYHVFELKTCEETLTVMRLLFQKMKPFMSNNSFQEIENYILTGDPSSDSLDILVDICIEKSQILYEEYFIDNLFNVSNNHDNIITVFSKLSKHLDISFLLPPVLTILNSIEDEYDIKLKYIEILVLIIEQSGVIVQENYALLDHLLEIVTSFQNIIYMIRIFVELAGCVELSQNGSIIDMIFHKALYFWDSFDENYQNELVNDLFALNPHVTTHILEEYHVLEHLGIL